MTMQYTDSKKIDQFVEKWISAFQNKDFLFIETEMGNDCAALGFVMDCGHNADIEYPGIMGDCEQLQKIIESVSNLTLLESAIYSKWRYFQNWACCSPWDSEWFLVALNKMKQLSVLQEKDK